MRGVSAASLGVTDIPMRLLIASVVMSITVPLVWSAYSDLSIKNTIVSVEREITELFEVIEDVMDAGVGSTLSTRFEVSSWGSARILSIKIGGQMNGSESSEQFLISYQISGYGNRIMSLDPPVAMLSSEAISLSEGIYDLKISHELTENGHICILEMV
jgi:hypothetical protein